MYNRIGTSYQRGYWPPLASSIYEQTNALYDKHDLYPSETCGLFLLGTEEENCNISSDRVSKANRKTISDSHPLMQLPYRLWSWSSS